MRPQRSELKTDLSDQPHRRGRNELRPYDGRGAMNDSGAAAPRGRRSHRSRPGYLLVCVKRVGCRRAILVPPLGGCPGPLTKPGALPRVVPGTALFCDETNASLGRPQGNFGRPRETFCGPGKVLGGSQKVFRGSPKISRGRKRSSASRERFPATREGLSRTVKGFGRSLKGLLRV